MQHAATLVVLALSLSACGSSDSSGGDDGDAGNGNDGSAPTSCADVSGTWGFGVSCRGPGSASDGSFAVTVTQTGCEVTVTEQDDQTPTSWVSSGTLDAAGALTLTGEFGFTSATTCAVQITGDAWSLTCVSGAETCTGDASR